MVFYQHRTTASSAPKLDPINPATRCCDRFAIGK
jgi:hypothetical protein